MFGAYVYSALFVFGRDDASPGASQFQNERTKVPVLSNGEKLGAVRSHGI